VSIADRVSRFNDLLQASFRNAMDAMENSQQTTAEIPLRSQRTQLPGRLADSRKKKSRPLACSLFQLRQVRPPRRVGATID